MSYSAGRLGWISGMPRSGTTWLSQILAASPSVRMKFCPLFSYEFKNALDETSPPDAWQQFFRDVYRTPSPYMDQEHLRKDGLVPAFAADPDAAEHLVIKSNRFHNLIPGLLEKVPTVRVVYLVRHPAATLWSWMNNASEFPAEADPAAEWRSGACRKTGPGEFWGFDDWKSVTSQALELGQSHPDRVRIQRYDRLTRDPGGEARALFDFLAIPYGDDVDAFIAASRSRHDPNKRSVFKTPGPDTAWQSGLGDDIIRDITNDLRGTPLAAFLDEG